MKFVFDLDGTICFKGRPVSNKILDSLLALTEQGHQVIFASARPIRDMLPVLRKDFHHYTLIGGNGSLTANKGKVISSTAFSLEVVEQLINLINEYEATYLIDGDWDYAYTGPENHPILRNLDPGKMASLVKLESLSSIVKILILTSKNKELLAERLAMLDIHLNKHAGEDMLDISPKGIHKWTALKKLGIKKGSFVAFGNDANDRTMFEHALHSIMIGNHIALQNLANESIAVTDNIDDELVAKIKELAEKFVS